MTNSSEPDSKDMMYVLKLFVAGDEPNSQRAKSNIQTICRLLDGTCHIEVVDVLESYQIALDYNVFLTPALIMLSPEPAVTILGDLSDRQEVLKAMRFQGEINGRQHTNL